MKLSNIQLSILHILWSSNRPLSLQEITEKLYYRSAGRIIASIAIENLLAKQAIYRAGSFQSYSNKKETVLILYAATVRFDEYYIDLFQNITSINIFYLTEKMLQSNKFTSEQLREFSKLLGGK